LAGLKELPTLGVMVNMKFSLLLCIFNFVNEGTIKHPLLCIFLSNASWIPRVAIGAKCRAACYSILCVKNAQTSLPKRRGRTKLQDGLFIQGDYDLVPIVFTRRIKHTYRTISSSFSLITDFFVFLITSKNKF